MATVHQRAASDTAKKVRFERQLRPKLARILLNVAKEVSNTIAAGGPTAALSVSLSTAKVEKELIAHYTLVAKTFSQQLSKRLPTAVATNGAERIAIDVSLEETFKHRARQQAERIVQTTQKNVATAVSRQISAGEVVSDRLLGRQVGAELARNGRKRASSIATVETQHSAETAKEVELQVVTGTDFTATKEWVSQGDSRVRSAHLSADGQVVAINQPFSVMGQSLMYPGDPAGSPGNVINCRCSSVVDEDAVIASRAP